MSEFSHIEITIETVATDGTRTRTTRWTCPSVEMGSTRDQRVQLRFAGEPVVVAGEPATRSRVGEPTAVGWEVIARTVEEYGRDLRHYGCPKPTGRKVKARRKRWR